MQGINPSRVALILDCFASMGSAKLYGQSDLARDMGVSPQIIRRRAQECRQGIARRGMPIDQVKKMCEVAVQQIPPLREENQERLTAWCIGLDSLFPLLVERLSAKLEAWLDASYPGAEKKEKEKLDKKLHKTFKRELRKTRK